MGRDQGWGQREALPVHWQGQQGVWSLRLRQGVRHLHVQWGHCGPHHNHNNNVNNNVNNYNHNYYYNHNINNHNHYYYYNHNIDNYNYNYNYLGYFKSFANKKGFILFFVGTVECPSPPAATTRMSVSGSPSAPFNPLDNVMWVYKTFLSLYVFTHVLFLVFKKITGIHIRRTKFSKNNTDPSLRNTGGTKSSSKKRAGQSIKIFCAINWL